MFERVVEWAAKADDDALLAELRHLEGQRRENEARESVVLAELENRGTFKRDEHASMWGLLRADLHWSDRDCKERMRLARFVAERPEAGEALFEAWVSVANINEVALGALRVDTLIDRDPVAERELGELMRVAEHAEHADLRVDVRMWERRHTPDESDDEAERAHDRRNAHVHVGPNGGEIVGEFGQLDAIEMAEIFGAFVDAEWHADWALAVDEHGEDATPADLARTDAQRRADALKQIFVDAASRPVGSKAPEPVANIHIDAATFSDLMIHAGLFPEQASDPFDDPTPHISQRMCRTDHGHTIDRTTALQVILEGHVRFIVRDDRGVPIRWGRAKRIFEGAARDAVRALSTRCTHPGCRVPTRSTETDHTQDWAAGGYTNPDNGNPRCRRHNNAKNRGFTVWRDPNGQFHTYRPNGSEIGSV